MSYAFQVLVNAVYCSFVGKRMRLATFLNLVDFAIFVSYFAYIVALYAVDLEGTWFGRTQPDGRTRTEVFYEYWKDNRVREVPLLMTCCFLLWLRFVYLLILLPWIGSLLSIVRAMTRPIFVFLSLFVLQLLFFACIGSLYFRDLEDFSSVPKASSSLWRAAVGEFSYSVIERSRAGSWFGDFFLTVFVAVNTILMISLVIAILSSVYSKEERKKSALWVMSTLRMREVTEADDEYSFLICGFPPLNSLFVLVMPFFLTIRREQRHKMNQVFLHIEFAPVAFVLCVFYFVYTLAILPLTYVKLWFHKLTMIFTSSRVYRRDRDYKFIRAMEFLVVGPLLLTVNFFIDLQYFVRHLY